MAEHTAVVAVTWQILGEAEDFTATFTIKGDSTFTLDSLVEQMSVGAESVQKILEPFGMHLIKHMAVNTADREDDGPPA